MDRFDWLRALRGRTASGLPARPLLLAGAAVLVASAAALGAMRSALAPQPVASAPDAGDVGRALAEGRLVLAQLEPEPPAAAAASPAPTLAEVVDLPIRRVRTTRIVLDPEEDVAEESPAPTRVDSPPAPRPDLDALLRPASSVLFPAPHATARMRYAALPEAQAPERFDLRPPPLPLLARLPAPPPPFEEAAGPARPPEGEHGAVEAAGDPPALPAPPPPRPEDATTAAPTPPPARPAGLTAPPPPPAAQAEAPPSPAQAEPAPARERTLGSLLRAMLGGGGIPGVAEAADGRTPTDCLPEPLRRILADVASAFGEVTLVSTEILNTGNHYRGSARHRFHQDCEAVDFRVAGDPREVVRWLRGRPDVGGVASYRNGVIHVDLDRAVAARLRREAAAAR